MVSTWVVSHQLSLIAPNCSTSFENFDTYWTTARNSSYCRPYREIRILLYVRHLQLRLYLALSRTFLFSEKKKGHDWRTKIECVPSTLFSSL